MLLKTNNAIFVLAESLLKFVLVEKLAQNFTKNICCSIHLSLGAVQF